jgi:hypothetical protein
MLKEFLNFWPAIKSVINLFNSKVFKKNKESLILKDTDITFLRQCLKIFSIFIKAIIKLQAKKYLIIYYLIPEVYNIYNRLEIIKKEYNISKYTLINT